MRTWVILIVWLLVLCILTIKRDPILLTLDVPQLNKADDLRGAIFHVPLPHSSISKPFLHLSTSPAFPASVSLEQGCFSRPYRCCKKTIFHYRKELWNHAKSWNKQLNHWCSFFSTTVVCEKIYQCRDEKNHSNVAVSDYRWNQWPSCAIWLWLPKLQTPPEKKGATWWGRCITTKDVSRLICIFPL